MSVQKQRGFRERNPGKPVLSILADRYAKWYLEFCPTGDTTRSELAEVFFENAREAAEDYVDMEECSRPAVWNDYTRDPESRHWMHKHFDERQAWAKSIDLLWTFSDGEDVDADALREALVRMSLRRHRDGNRRDRNEEHIFVKAAGIVREKAGLDRMTDARREAIHEDYR
jgi:hypothetical protein